MPSGYVDIVTAEESRLALDARWCGPTATNVSPRRRREPIGRSAAEPRSSGGVRHLLRHDAGRPSASRTPFVFKRRPSRNPRSPRPWCCRTFSRRPARRARQPSRCRWAINRIYSSRPSHNGMPRLSTTLDDGLWVVVCRDARPRDVVHARHQRAGAGRRAVCRQAAAFPAVSGYQLPRQRGDTRVRGVTVEAERRFQGAVLSARVYEGPGSRQRRRARLRTRSIWAVSVAGI